VVRWGLVTFIFRKDLTYLFKTVSNLSRYICQGLGSVCKVNLVQKLVFLYIYHKDILFALRHILNVCRHAKRHTVTMDDVKLTARRTTALVGSFQI